MIAPRKISAAELERLKDDNPCDEVAGKWVRLRANGRKMIGPCPICSDDPQSLDATRFECWADGWVCAVCPDGGDVIKLVQKREQLEFLAAVDWLGGVQRVDPAEEARRAAEREHKRAEAEKNSAIFREQERARVFDIWRHGTSIADTDVERYLALRVGTLPASLRMRCIAAMPYYATGKRDAPVIHRGPAMLVPIIGRDGKFAALHVTWIDLGAPKGKVALTDPETGAQLPAKKVRGSKAGGRIELVVRDAPRRLVIGEGIEKVLAVWLALDVLGRPTTTLDDTAFWTSIDLGNLGGRAAEAVPHPTLKDKGGRTRRVPGPQPDLSEPSIEIPDSVEEVVILGDATSDRYLTECAIARAAARWAKNSQGAGRRILVAWCWPDADFDDVLRQAATDGVPLEQACARIAAAIDAAMPVAAPAVHEQQPATQTKSRRSAARPQDPSPPIGEAAGAAPSPASSAAASSAAAAPFDSQSEQSTAETLAIASAPDTSARWMDEEEKLEDAIAACADLDENDVDNGKRLRRYFGRDLLAMAQSGQAIGGWLHWSGMHWDYDGGVAGAHILAQRLGDLIMQEADYLVSSPFERQRIEEAQLAAAAIAEIDAELGAVKGKKGAAAEKRKALNERRKPLADAVKRGMSAQSALIARKISRRDFGNQTKNLARIKNALECAGPHVRRFADAFNVDPLLVATRTHTLRFVREGDPECPDPEAVRWRARVLADREHRRSDLLTCYVPVAYIPDAAGLKWGTFLTRMLPKEEKRRTVQAFAGLGLTGLPIQRLMYHIGGGANGKSVFLEVITRLLGDSFAVGLPVESITGMASGASGAQASPDIARLFGKRMLRVHELPQGALLKAEVIKKLTGGERMTARDLYKGFFEFQPRAKPHMSGNDIPTFDGSDGGMRRRLIMMEWTETIPEAEQRDFEEFVSELLTEGPAILNWLIAGALDYLQNGLVIAEGDRAYTAEFFDEMDPVGQFVAGCVEACAGSHEKARDVYNAYVAWSMANAKKPMSESRFGRIMKKKVTRDDSGRVHMYRDVKLHDVPERPDEQGGRGGGGPQSREDLTF